MRVLGALAVLLLCAGCDTTGEDLMRNTARGVAEGACRNASNCDLGGKRDPLAEKPAWERGTGASMKDPFPLRRGPAR